MSKPRKQYRPKYSRQQMADKVRLALMGRSNEIVSDAGAAMELVIFLWQYFADLKAGTLDHKGYNILCAAANVVVILCERGIMPEMLETCVEAQTHLDRAKDYWRADGRFYVPESAYAAIAALIETRDTIMHAEGYTAGLEYQAAAIVADRLNEGFTL